MTPTGRRVLDRTAVPRRILAPIAVTLLVLTGCHVEPRRDTPLGPAIQLTSVDGGQAVTQPELSPGADLELHHDPDAELGLAFTFSVDPGRPILLTGARLDGTEPRWATPLSASVGARPLPTELAGGEHAVINLRVRPGICSDTWGRVTPTITGLVVDMVNAGRRETWRVPLGRHLVVRTPGTVACGA